MPKLEVKIDLMSYDKSRPLIQNLKLEVEEGEIVALLGPSGIGKTTLLRIIAALESDFDGQIKLDNQIVDRPRKDIQLVFQDYRLLPWKTVSENIALANHLDSSKNQERINEWVEIMGLKGKENVWPKTLSGGQKSRVALARAFYAEPKVLLLDEPFQNLDSETKYPIMKKLRKILKVEKVATIIVTHTVEDAVFLADTIYTLSNSPLEVMSRRSMYRSGPALNGTEIARLTGEINQSLLGSSAKE